MEREKIKMEYIMKGGTESVLWSIVGTPTGMESWFADKVTAQEKIWTFQWGKTERRQAEVIGCRTNHHIRFHWLDDEERKSFFEFKIVYNELTEELTLEVTDWAEPGEIEDLRDLWDSDIEKLRRVSGL